jgi:threonine dehydratase
MSELIPFARITEAADAIAGHVPRTPAVHSPGLSRLLGAETFAKLEILHDSGCFKPRGITNLIRLLTPQERAAGLVTVTGGNHGIALSGVARTLGIDATIVMPRTAPERSKETVRANGATLIEAPDVTTAFTIAEAERANGRTYVHPYDDPRIIAGHGTAGLEFATDVPALTDVLVSIGGGALISGVATAVKAINPAIRVWGVETEGADAMSRAIAAGEPVPIRVTSISTTLGAPIVTDRTLAHVRALVEEVFVVPDADAVDGVVRIAEEAKLWVEPAAGCLVPAAHRVRERVGPDAVLGLVLCGGNTSVADLCTWLRR